MKFSTILKELELEFPGFRLVVKEKSKFMKFLYKFTLMKWWCPDFMAHYTTTVGKVVYMPQYLIGTSNGTDVLRHERVHLRDSKGWLKSIFFAISYILLPLPLVITFRAYWELRAYRESLKCHMEKYGYPSEEDLDWYTGQFTGKSYFFMAPFPKIIKSIFRRYADEFANDK